MTNEELTMQVVRYCSLGEMPEVTESITGNTFVVDGFHTDGWIDFEGSNYRHLDNCTIKLHHPDKWQSVLDFKAYDYGRDGRAIFISQLVNALDVPYFDRPQWVNDLFYKYNIALDADWKQHENIEFYDI